jgi:hypothetical protein
MTSSGSVILFDVESSGEDVDTAAVPDTWRAKDMGKTRLTFMY